MKRATRQRQYKVLSAVYFNPRPREEGDFGKRGKTRGYKFISIHALVKRATVTSLLALKKVTNFNPRPREEGDGVRDKGFCNQSNFNPRPREEGDNSFVFRKG